LVYPHPLVSGSGGGQTNAPSVAYFFGGRAITSVTTTNL
jgi:hypothetical protein